MGHLRVKPFMGDSRQHSAAPHMPIFAALLPIVDPSAHRLPQ
jgi:hypothetical protein